MASGTVSPITAVSEDCGPISMNPLVPACARAVTAAWKATGWRICCTQYSGSASSVVMARPDTVDTNGIVGSARVTAVACSRNGASTGSIARLWKAWLTRSGLAEMPRVAAAAITSAIASLSPDSTMLSAALTAAISTGVSPAPSSSATASASARSETMPPPEGSADMSRPR
ncbi:hypothetical protein TPAU25S_00001 [Tsukamurella paurometabola]